MSNECSKTSSFEVIPSEPIHQAAAKPHKARYTQLFKTCYFLLSFLIAKVCNIKS